MRMNLPLDPANAVRIPREDHEEYQTFNREAWDMPFKELEAYIKGAYENMSCFSKLRRELLPEYIEKLDVFEEVLKERRKF